MPAPPEPPQTDGGLSSPDSGTSALEADAASSPSVGSDASRRVPDFFVVGHPKSGTTALHIMLSAHPSVHMPIKETRFFAPELRSRFHRFGPDKLPTDLDTYLAGYAGARPDQICGEATPMYLRSRGAIERIAAVAPDAKIIALLREPASFLRSFHLQLVHNHIETQKDFRKAVLLEDRRREGKSIPLLSHGPSTLMYSDHVRYVEQLERLYEHFPRDRVLVLIYEDYRRDNEATMRRVQRFLGIDDTLATPQVNTKPLPAIRSLTLHQLERVVLIARRNRDARSPLLRAANAVTGRFDSPAFGRLFQRLLYKPSAPPDEQFMRELRRRFKPEVERLSEYLDRDLVSFWGYDDLD
jgi:Sulfotransferase domain